MNILLVSKYTDSKNGQWLVVETLIKYLQKKHDVIVLLSKKADDEIVQKYSKASFYSSRSELLKSHDPSSFQVIHFHNPLHWFTFFTICTFKNKNKICTFHSKLFSPCWWKNIILMFRKTIQLNILPLHIDTFVSLTEYDRKYFSKRMIIQKKHMVISNCVDDYFFREDEIILTSPFRILFVGRFLSSKGFYEVISAAEKLPSYFFVCIGKGGVLHQEIPQNVILLESQKTSEIKKHLKNTHLFLLPSYSEGMPLSLLESMAMGLPIICSNVGGLPEIIADGVNGKLVDPGDVNAIVDAIEYLVKNKVLYKKISKENLLKSKREYHSETFIKKHLLLYAKKDPLSSQ